MIERFNQLPIAHRSSPASMLFVSAEECIVNNKSKFKIAKHLIDYADLGQEVLIVGRAYQAEIWDVKTYEAYEKENLNPETLMASLREIEL